MSESARPSPATAREALLAELLGDVQHVAQRVEMLLDRLSAADTDATNTAAALKQASAEYRHQVDDMLARLRVEFAQLLATAAQHAVGQLAERQTTALQQGAVAAVRQALLDVSRRDQRRQLWLTVALSVAASGLATAAVMALMR